jgi:hypothetical protein
MTEIPDDRVGAGLEGTVSEQEGVPALAEDEISTERGDERSAAPGMEQASGPLPEEPDQAGSE